MFTIEKPFKNDEPEQTVEIPRRDLIVLVSLGWSKLGLSKREVEALKRGEVAVRA